MECDGKIGMNGLDVTSRSQGSPVGIYGNGRKGVPRASTPRYARWNAHLGKRAARRAAGLLIVVVAALVATAVVSSVSLAPSAADGKAPNWSKSPVSEMLNGIAQQKGSEAGPPPPPFMLFGMVYDGAGNPMYDANITITDLTTGDVANTTSVNTEGYPYYEYNLNDLPSYAAVNAPINNGDVIRVEAVNMTLLLYGSNESVVDTGVGYMYMDITMSTVIPEFSTVIVPVVGLMALVVLVGVRRRNGQA